MSTEQELTQAREEAEAASTARAFRIAEAVELAALKAGATQTEADVCAAGMFRTIQIDYEELGA